MADRPDPGVTLEEGPPKDRADKLASGAPSAPLAVTVGDPLTEQDPGRNTPLAEVDINTVPRALYELGVEVARGGLGRILRARDRRLNRVVAIKELLRPTNASRARFLREIEVTVRLEHPNIVAIHEAGKWPDGKLFYAMNFVDGQTLLEAIAKTQSYDQRLALLPNVIAIAEAMAYAHSEGVIHRDLKPANVLVGQFGETVVIDWGLAKYTEGTGLPDLTAETERAERGLTLAGGIVGTPPYMSPEQARGEEANEGSDVYALGAILYHVLSGREPYSQYTNEELLEKIETVTPTPLQQLEPELPADLTAIVEKAMAREPSARYPDARAMVEELLLFTRGRMVGAYDYSLWDMIRRFVQRHVGAVSTAAVATVVLLLLATTMVHRIRAERDVATHERDVATQRAEALIVSQARALTGSDPTLAVAKLKDLSSHPHGATSVAARAEELGVARWVLHGHQDSIRCLDYSPDSQMLLSGSSDKTLRLWSPGSSEPSVLEAHDDQIAACRFAPNGEQLASAGYDGKVLLWTPSGQLERSLPPHLSAVKALAFSDDGARLFSAAEDGGIRFWDASNWSYQDHPAENPRWPQLLFTPASERLLSGPHDGRFRSWQMDGRFEETPESIGPINVAATLADGTALLGLPDGRLVLWDTQSTRPLATLGAAVVALAVPREQEAQSFVAAADRRGRVFRVRLADGSLTRVSQHLQRVEVLAVSAGGRFVASGGWDKQVQLNDAKTGTTRTLQGHGDVVATLAFSPDLNFLASGSWDRTIRVWPLQTPLHDQRRVLRGHRVGVKSARFSHDGRLVVTGGHDNTVRVWDVATGKSRQLIGHEDHVFRAIFSPNDQLIASSSDDKTVRLWRVPDLRTSSAESQPETALRVLTGHEADVEELAFSPDGKLLVSAAEDTTARLWNVTDGSSRVLLHDHDVTQVAFDPSGERFATASRGGQVRVFDRNGRELQVYREHAGEAYGLAFLQAPEHTGWLASSDRTGRIIIRTGGTARPLVIEGMPGAGAIAFSPNERWLAVSGARPHLWLCPFASGNFSANDCADLDAHSSTVHAMRFTPNSELLASAGGDGDVYVWDLRSREYRVYLGHDAAVFDLDISPDGQQLLSASGDETARLWPLESVAPPEQLQQVLAAMTSERSGE